MTLKELRNAINSMPHEYDEAEVLGMNEIMGRMIQVFTVECPEVEGESVVIPIKFKEVL